MIYHILYNEINTFVIYTLKTIYHYLIVSPFLLLKILWTR